MTEPSPGTPTVARRTGAKLRLLALLLLPAALGFALYLHVGAALTATSGAVRLEGTVDRVAAKRESYRDSDGTSKTETTYKLFVRFRTPDGRALSRAVQHNGAGDDDVIFGQDAVDMGRYGAGRPVALLYHPELEDKVWLDDFRAIWFLSLLLAGFTLVALAVVLFIAKALWPKPPPDPAAVREAELRQRYGLGARSTPE